MSEGGDRVAELRGAVERQSKKFATSIVTLGTVGAYIFIVAIATDHRQLLEEKPTLLPLVNLSVPVTWFAAFAPVVILVLAASVIVNFARLRVQRDLFEREVKLLALKSERDFQRQLVDALPFSMSSSTWVTHTSTAITYSISAILPLIVLLTLQARFLPFHSTPLTWFQRIVVLVLAVIIASPLSGARERSKHSWIVAAGLIICMSAVVCFSFFVLTIPNELAERMLVRALPDQLVVSVPIRPDFSMVDEGRAGAPSLPPRRVPLPTYWLLEASNNPLGLRRNISVEQESFVTQQPTDEQISRLGAARAWQQFGRGISLRGRDLRYADLSGVDFRGADLRGTRLNGADLRGSNLEFANLSVLYKTFGCVRDPESSGCITVLDGATMSGAVLRHASMANASLIDVTASDVTFEDANARGAKFNVSDLRNAVFARADLTFSTMNGADLERSVFVKAKMGWAKARSANLSGAIIALTDEIGDPIDMTGASLRRAHLFDARIDIALGDARDAEILGSSLPLSSNTDWRHVSTWQPLEVDTNEMFRNIADRELVLATSSAMQSRVKEISSQPVLDVSDRSVDFDAPETVDQLLKSACGSPVLSLGLLRRISIYKSDMDAETRLVGLGPGSKDPWTDDRARLEAPFKVWEKLQSVLTDKDLCGPNAEIVASHIEKW